MLDLESIFGDRPATPTMTPRQPQEHAPMPEANASALAPDEAPGDHGDALQPQGEPSGDGPAADALGTLKPGPDFLGWRPRPDAQGRLGLEPGGLPEAPEPATTATATADPSAPVVLRAVPGPGGCLALVCSTPELAAAVEAGRPMLETLLVELAAEPSAPAVGPEASDWPGAGIAPNWTCPDCGGLLWWEDLRGGRHCLDCERGTFERSRRLADRAARLRRIARPAQGECSPP